MKRNKDSLIFYLTFVFSLIYLQIERIFQIVNFEKINYWITKKIVDLFGDVMRISKEYDIIRKDVINKVTLIIPSYGCSHYFNNGGCDMCGFNKEIEKYNFRYFHPLALIALTRIFLIFLEKNTRKIKVDQLEIYMAGSFINEEELPDKAQDLIINYFSKSKILKLVIESRAEYIIKYKQKLDDYMGMLQDKEVEVAIGLESSDDKIRNKLVKKSLSKKQYEKAVNLVKEIGGQVSTYILVGAPFLDEKEIVEKTIESAIYAWKAGSHKVNFEVYCVQEGTNWAKLYIKGHLKLPSLWNIIDIIKRVDLISQSWYLGEFSDWPEPIAIPINCEKCTARCMKALSDLRKTHNINILQEIKECSCNRRVKENE